LNADQSLLLDVGIAGYSSFQVSDDSGSAAAADPVKDEVHAIGVQVGLTNVPWNLVLTFQYFYELDAHDRFQGQSVGLNLAMKF
jgi:hypothetical protein